MKKNFVFLFVLLLICSSLFAYDYVGLTDTDVKNFIGFCKEDGLGLFMAFQAGVNVKSKLDSLTEKYKINDLIQNGKIEILIYGYAVADTIISTPSSDIQLMESFGLDLFTMGLEEVSVDSRDIEVMSRHKNDFISLALTKSFSSF